jgi:hypothetical protein
MEPRPDSSRYVFSRVPHWTLSILPVQTPCDVIPEHCFSEVGNLHVVLYVEKRVLLQLTREEESNTGSNNDG